MKKYKDGTIIEKKFRDMSYEEIHNIDVSTLENEDEILEFVKWLKIRDEELYAPLNY